MNVPLKVHEQPQDSSPFDEIRRFRPDGSEYWGARELMPYLGYVEWRKMAGAVERAQMSCATQGYDPAGHFVRAAKMVDIGSGAARNIDDWELTRLGCYLTAMNGDVRKPEIAAAQGDLFVMTRVAEGAAATTAADVRRVDRVLVAVGDPEGVERGRAGVRADHDAAGPAAGVPEEDGDLVGVVGPDGLGVEGDAGHADDVGGWFPAAASVAAVDEGWWDPVDLIGEEAPGFAGTRPAPADGVLGA